MHNYDLNQWLDHIAKIHAKPIDYSLDRSKKLISYLGLSKPTSKVITVAGTNGKGTTVDIIARLITAYGKTQGTLTSPHLVKFNERCQINLSPVQDQIWIDAFEKIEQARNYLAIPLSYYEFITCAGIYILACANLDYIILEVGMGGELDTINCISPNLAIITSIGLDHQEFLGDSLESIAKAKAGILRDNISVILGKSVTQKNVYKIATDLNCKLYQENIDFSLNEFNQMFDMPDINYPNTSLAIGIFCLKLLFGLDIVSLSKIIKNLDGASLAGRCQVIKLDNNKTVILDVAHNQMSANKLKEFVSKFIRQNNFTGTINAIWYSLKDKDHKGIVTPLEQLVDNWHIYEPNELKSACPFGAARKSNICSLVDTISTTNKTVLTNLGDYFANLAPNSLTLIFGSFYIVADTIVYLQEN